MLGTCIGHAWMLFDQLSLQQGSWRFLRTADCDDSWVCEFCGDEADDVAEKVS